MRKKSPAKNTTSETASLFAEEVEKRSYDMALAHGQAGFSAVLKLHPAIVLCDASMPVMGGFEVLDRLVEPAQGLG